ncbi:MAG: hypothetical protein AAGC64_10725 [Bacteroidota bacterium]
MRQSAEGDSSFVGVTRGKREWQGSKRSGGKGKGVAERKREGEKRKRNIRTAKKHKKNSEEM